MLNFGKSREKGTSTVEAALTLLAFFVMIFAVVEAGRFINVQMTLTDAAREGARLAVAPASGTSTLPTNSEIEAEVNRFLSAANISGASTSVTTVTSASGDVFTVVNVGLTYQVISLSMFAGLEVDLNGTSMMRNETSP